MPSGYQISCTTNETQIRFIGKNDPSSMKERKELLINKLESNLKAGETLIQLTELPHKKNISQQKIRSKIMLYLMAHQVPVTPK